jgi:hypothetical protein
LPDYYFLAGPLSYRINRIPVFVPLLALKDVNDGARNDPDVVRVFLHRERFSGSGLSVRHDGRVVTFQHALKSKFMIQHQQQQSNNSLNINNNCNSNNISNSISNFNSISFNFNNILSSTKRNIINNNMSNSISFNINNDFKSINKIATTSTVILSASTSTTTTSTATSIVLAQLISFDL